jgi:hypothetical protein
MINDNIYAYNYDNNKQQVHYDLRVFITLRGPQAQAQAFCGGAINFE